jgi:hypothetical protein
MSYRQYKTKASSPQTPLAVPFRERSEQIWQVLALTLQKLRELDSLRRSLESVLQGTVPPAVDDAVLTLHQAARVLAVQTRTVRKHCNRLGIDADRPFVPEALSRLRNSLAQARRRKHLAERNRSRQPAKPPLGLA